MKIQIEDRDENKGYFKDFKTVADLPKYGDLLDKKYVVYSGYGDIIHDEPGTTYREWVIIISKNKDILEANDVAIFDGFSVKLLFKYLIYLFKKKNKENKERK